MKIVVINLAHRQDRLSFMREQLSGWEWARYPAINGHTTTLEQFKQMGFTPYKKWIDPMLGRKHTLTDIAAMASHYMVWSDCAVNNEPVLILEDDAELKGKLDAHEVEQLLEEYDIVYLDHKEMFFDHAVSVDERFVQPYYPYWNDAYAISPRLAKRIIKSKYRENLIPVDEFYPLINGVDYNETCLSNEQYIKDNFNELKGLFDELIGIKSIAYKVPIFRQVSRSVLGSDIENGPKISEEKMENKVHVYTVATDESRLNYLNLSKEKFNIDYTNLGHNVQWNGGDMSRPGGGQKINLVKQQLENLPDDDIVLFVDGYDVYINDPLNTIVERFKGFDCGVLFAAEKTCWPDRALAPFFTESHTDYKYPNSGAYIGYVSGLKALFNTGLGDGDDDQLYVQKQIIKTNLDNKDAVKLDYENYLFQCLADSVADVTVNKNRQLLNTNTRCCPCILHGNGGDSTKKQFDNLVDRITKNQDTYITTSGVEFINTKNIKQLDTDILEMDFMTPAACQKLIDLAESNGKWESMYGDKFPGQEIRIREFSMEFWNDLEQHFKTVVNPLIEKYWWPLLMYGLRDAFIIRYNKDTQSNLACHHDASLVSGLVKLNDGYTGGETYFHRQNLSNINTPVGKMILWPGQVTHGHEGRTVHTGTKYNLVIWTSRHKGDINY